MSEKQFNTLVQGGADLTAILDVNGLCKYVTPYYTRLAGYNEGEVVGFSAFNFIHYDDVERVRHNFKSLVTEKRVKTEPYRFKCKDHRWCWMQSTGTNMLHDEAIEGFVINTVDITDLINTRNALQESNDRYELVNKATKDAIYDWDVVKDEFRWGKNLQRIFACPKSDIPFRLSDWISMVHKEELVQIRKSFKKFIADKERTQWTKSFRVKKGDGSYAYVEETGHLVRDVNGKSIRMIGVLRDVTKSKELQTLLDSATSLARVGAWEFDVIKQQVYWSAMTKEIHEVDANFVPVLDEGITFYKAGESRNTILKKINDAIEKGISWDEELQIVTARGNELWVRAIGNTDMLNGQCVRIYGSFQDIDKQKTAELKLQAALKEKSTILESIGDAFFALDRNWMVTYWNKQAKTLLGLKREQIVGKNFWNVFEDAVGLQFYTQYHIAMSTGNNVQFEEYYPIKNSWYEVSAYASDNGLSIYFRDITSRKLADEEIYRSNERFVKVTEATNDVIWDLDIINDRLNYSGSFHKLFGHHPDMSIPTLQWWSRYIYKDDSQAVIESLNYSINDTNALEWQMEYRFLKENGDIAHVMDRGVIIRDNEGNAIRMVGAMADITERKQYEQLLKSLNNTLDAKARELTTYVNAIEAQNERLRKIAWTQSHMVREPLTRIMGIAKLLVDHTVPPEQKNEMLNHVLKSANELDKVIRDIVESSHQQNLS
ncbi:PAS domain-containing protein [Segetibacter koreensis]|uniref:PAS domain-containing protein n=1 Tax=Segetibacter koreensis TaxID=398037 RepID=UPI00035F220D|nr:PAS domain-containing protein [Segetibacter koreensis]